MDLCPPTLTKAFSKNPGCSSVRWPLTPDDTRDGFVVRLWDCFPPPLHTIWVFVYVSLKTESTFFKRHLKSDRKSEAAFLGSCSFICSVGDPDWALYKIFFYKMYWHRTNNCKPWSTVQVCHLIKINNVEELNKTSLFNGSIIKTCVCGEKKPVAVVASIKQVSGLRSHKITQLSTKGWFHGCSDVIAIQDQASFWPFRR